WVGLIVVTVLPAAFAVVIAVATFAGEGAELYQMGVIPAVIATGTWIYFKKRQSVAARPCQPSEDSPLSPAAAGESGQG
ncbi:MAG TPA: hypothetical protein VMI06_18920, partial [Terriglobia bacterium]|nr:hypothetical protein [Terriglobia bacterium]